MANTTVVLVDPRYDPNLKLNVTAWGNMPSAATLAIEQGQMNAVLGSWPEVVCNALSNALASSMEVRVAAVKRATQADFAALPKDQITFVRSYLTAGFVYKTFTSSDFVPFVQVVLELVVNARPVYHRLYVATGRPYNMFMDALPPSTSYVLADLASLHANRAQALDALALLAEQLGRQFAAELAA